MRGDFVKFEDFELEPHAYHLTRSGRSLKLERIPMELLVLLVERHAQLVTREEIIEKLWGKNAFLDTDNAINTAIRKIRHTLGDDPEQPRFVQTVTGNGYRFIAPVVEGSPQAIAEAEKGPALDVGSRHWNRLSLRLVIPLLLVVASGPFVAAYLMRAHNAPVSSPSQARVMLAVLPFTNLSNESDQEYFSDGLTEEMITDLGELSPQHLGVIARTSAMAYKETNKSAGQIGQELGVDYLLEGSVRRDGARVRISAQLIRVKDQTHIWAKSYDREIRDFLELQKDLGEAISQQVRVNLASAQRLKHVKSPAVNPDAYDDYLKGRYFWNRRTAADTKKAIEYFQGAIQKDPSYALAYTGLADCYLIVESRLPPREASPKAKAAAAKALELDDSLAEAHTSLALASMLDYDWPAANREFQRAFELNANYPTAHQWYSAYLAEMGRLDESLAETRQAERLDPLSPIIAFAVGRTLVFARDYDQAFKAFKKALELDPDFIPANDWVGRALEYQRKTKEALVWYEKYRLRMAKSSEERAQWETLFGNLRIALRTSGSRGAYRVAVNWTLQTPPIDAYRLAGYYAVLGEKDNAFEWMEKLYEARKLGYLKVDPAFDPLRSDPRFVDLLRRMGLPQ